MTLGDAKRKVMMLLDEYSSGGTVELDEDIAVKMNDFFDIAQKDMAQWQPIERRAAVTLDGTGSQALPSDVGCVLRITKGGHRARGYEIIDGKIVYAAGDTSTLTLDYLATPETITQATPDTYTFEIGEAAANCMPFFVAGQQVFADLVQDYRVYYNTYQQMRSALPRSAGPRVGSVRQELWQV